MPNPSPFQVDAMRAWLVGRDALRLKQPPAISRPYWKNSPDTRVTAKIDAHYPGGVEGFLADHQEAES